MMHLYRIASTAGRAGIAAAMVLTGGVAAAQTVKAPAGEIIGASSDGLDIYLGIPYAEAPVGQMRWAPPKARAPFTAPFEATSTGAECVQFATFWRPGKPASWTEDCLSLTVYAPSGGGTNLPVFVGYHGGGFVNGAKSDWDPRELALAGNVVVTANYRLGAMGFLALDALNAESPDKKSSGNYGNLDKVEVLRWVSKNISAFGGDPKRVTIAGQSAGARGVCFLLATPEAKDMFHGAIIESGGDCAGVANADAIKMGDKFAQTVGCADASDKLACLRAKTPADILAAQAEAGITYGLVYGGADLPNQAVDAFATGTFNRVPVIVGNNRNESRVFVYEANDLQKQPVTQALYEKSVRALKGVEADAVLAAYKEDAEDNPGRALGDIQTDQRYACAVPKVIDALAKWAPTYAYLFDDETAPIRSYAAVPPSFDLGVPHSAELSYVWGEQTVPNGLTAEQKKLATLMRNYWIGLTDPKGIAAAGQPAWPAFGPDSKQRLVFSAGGKTDLVAEEDYLKPHHCDLYR